MASPNEKKGQKKGSCGHIMASFDLHSKCARCRDKLIGDDPCVLNKESPCHICDSFTDEQREALATPVYRIRKEKKAGTLVSPKDVKVLSAVDNEPTFSSPATPATVSSIPVSVNPPAYVTADQLSAISDKWTEQFARMEALLSRGNIFSTPVSSVKPIDTQNLISSSPFIPPSTRPTGSVEIPVDQATQHAHKTTDKSSDKSSKEKDRRRSSKSKKASKEKDKPKTSKSHDRSSPVHQASSGIKPSGTSSSGPEAARRLDLSTKSATISRPASPPTDRPSDSALKPVTGSQPSNVSSTGDLSTASGLASYSHYIPPDQPSTYQSPDEFQLDTGAYSEESSDKLSASDDENLSDTTEKTELTEDMTYRETVRSVRSFMGWNHIPVFEADYSEPDKSNNPWRGKNPKRPSRISVAMPPDDWLCQKLERLNLTVAEGYPSRAHDSAGLKRDQFVKVPNQSRWYAMHMLKTDGPHRPGRSVFSWRNSECKVNSQFPRITRASAYPSTGPPSRPIPQESLRRWERDLRKDSYILNHAAGFNRCASELQDKMTQNVNTLCNKLHKGKLPKDVSSALTDLRDQVAFHQRVSVAMGTSLQHLADSIFVFLANMIILRRDSYLDFVKQGINQDTMNLLRNSPLFGYGLFPDAVIATAEQDIQKHNPSSMAQGPGSGGPQHTNWRGANRYRPYDKKDSKQASAPDRQAHQPWRQFSRNKQGGRNKGKGSNPRFSKSHGYKGYK